MTNAITREDVLALFERIHHPRQPDRRFEIGGHEFTSIDQAVQWLGGEGREILFRERQCWELRGRPKRA